MTEGNPCGVNDLLDTFGLLAAAMLDDPLLALANAVCWLDPLWETNDDDLYDEGDGVGLALCITRSAFPDIYAGAVERIRSGASEKELDTFICGAISQRGIPLDNLEFLGYGIPLTACGIDTDRYTVFAFCMCIDRSLMLRTCASYLRAFFEGDVLFSSAFGTDL